MKRETEKEGCRFRQLWKQQFSLTLDICANLGSSSGGTFLKKLDRLINRNCLTLFWEHKSANITLLRARNTFFKVCFSRTKFLNYLVWLLKILWSLLNKLWKFACCMHPHCPPLPLPLNYITVVFKNHSYFFANFDTRLTELYIQYVTWQLQIVLTLFRYQLDKNFRREIPIFEFLTNLVPIRIKLVQ